MVIVSLGLVFYNRYLLAREEIESKISYEKFQEENHGSGLPLDDNSISIEVDTEYLEENIVDKEKPPKNESKKSYIGYLIIPKINLNYGLVSKNSFYNNVNRNIQIIKVSDYPDVINGNLILAAHSGSSDLSYFKNLYKLDLEDQITIAYKNYNYVYQIVNIYQETKDGGITIKRNTDINTLTLVTCTKGSNTKQTVFIAELISKSIKDSDKNG